MGKKTVNRSTVVSRSNSGGNTTTTSPRRVEDMIHAFMEDAPPSLEEEHAPLVNHQVLEMESIHKDHDVILVQAHRSCFGDFWRVLGGFLLAALVVSPLFIMYHPPNTIETYFGNGDKLECARDLNINYLTLYQDTMHASSWCHNNSPSCTCRNPLLPTRAHARDNFPQVWDTVFQQHVVDVSKRLAKRPKPNVVFVGDSITEHWNGTSLGQVRPYLQNVSSVFDDLFVTPTIHGMPLGISGDRCPQLLYRLQNGEAPSELQPKVWWLLIGTNDLGSDHCSATSVLMGILNIVWELLSRSDDSKIVLNGILPRKSDWESNDLNLTSPENAEMHRDIQWINARLKCFVESLRNVEFFNSTDTFLIKDQLVINHDKMEDGLHPSYFGSKVWGHAIVLKLNELLYE